MFVRTVGFDTARVENAHVTWVVCVVCVCVWGNQARGLMTFQAVAAHAH